MKLNELLGVKKYKDMDYQSVLNDLFGEGSKKDINFTRLDNGGSANAIALQIKDYAYKFWFEDTAYEAFIEYVLKNQNNRFLPKLESKIKTLPAFFLRNIEAKDTIKYVKMELLSHSANIKESYHLINDVNGNPILTSFNDVCHVCRNIILHNDRINFYHSFFRRLFWFHEREDFSELYARSEDYERGLFDFRSNIKDKNAVLLLDTIFDIIKLAKKTSSRIDLHSNNYMSRNGNPVIIDPIANNDSIDANDLIIEFATNHRNGTINKSEDSYKIASRRTK